MLNSRVCLVLAPHTDDGELGCGGTISRLVDAGADVHYLALSICEESVPEGFPKDVLATECLAATEALGVPSTNVHLERFPVRRFPEQRQAILQTLIDLRARLRPDLVLLPAGCDVHQDHRVVHDEGVRAFKHSSLLGYELPWNHLESSTSLYVKLSQRHVDAKLAAIRAYRSQAHRPYTNDTMASLAKVRGLQAGCELAEAFQTIRMIVG